MSKPDLDIFRDVLGVDLDPDRLQQNLEAFSDILSEIRKLRDLNLTDTHPVVVFDPTYGYSKEVRGDR